MKPYYQDDYCTIYHGDCREVELETYDLLLTDPPYGIGEAAGKNKSRVQLALPTDYGDSTWDDEPVSDWLLSAMRLVCEKHMIFGGNYYDLPPTSCWLIWDKMNGGSDFADCEMVWTNLKGAVRLKRHQWNGMLRKGKEARWHPTQKPLEIMSWCLQQAGEVESVLDPWMGSGTTLRACKDRSIHSVGIEINEKYCEIAAQRLSQEVLDFGC